MLRFTLLVCALFFLSGCGSDIFNPEGKTEAILPSEKAQREASKEKNMNDGGITDTLPETLQKETGAPEPITDGGHAPELQPDPITPERLQEERLQEERLQEERLQEEPTAEEKIKEIVPGCIPGQPRRCYEGPPGSEGQGLCKAGSQLCLPSGLWGPCVGQDLPGIELCNGVDDDCNGKIDDDYPEKNAACRKLPLKGSCSFGTYNCLQGQLECEPAIKPTPETCNGKDDDCNGIIDDSYPEKDKACQVTGKQGPCVGGAMACVSGKLECKEKIKPKVEECNNLDDDCDGVIDNGVTTKACTNTCGTGKSTCISGQWSPCDATGSRACGTAKGECKQGQESCEKGAWSGSCVGATGPKTETCNGKDDDCDGVIDEDYLTKGKACTQGVGACARAGLFVCKADGSGVECNVTGGTASQEVCDGKDNDCDGVIDNGLKQACTRICGTTTTSGIETCTAGKWAGCTAQTPQTEVCDGKDNDCNGLVDDGITGKTCTVTGTSGPCAQGTSVCLNGQLSCKSTTTPTREICNKIDDDCNGVVDDNCLDYCKNPYLLNPITNHQEDVNIVRFSPKGNFLVTISPIYIELKSGSSQGSKERGSELLLRDPKTGKATGAMIHESPTETLYFSPDEKKMYSLHYEKIYYTSNNRINAGLLEWDLSTKSVIRTHPLFGPYTNSYNVAPQEFLGSSGPLSKDGKYFTFGSLVSVYDPIDTKIYPNRVKYNIETKKVSILAQGGFTLSWDGSTILSSGTAITVNGNVVPGSKGIPYVSNKDQNIIALDTDITLYDIVTYKKIKSWTGLKPIYHFAQTPSGEFFAVASQTEIKIWEYSTGKLLATLNTGTTKIISMDISPDGKKIAWTSGPTTTVWDIATQKTDYTIQKSPRASVIIKSHTLSPDGKLLAISDSTGVTIWDIDNKKLLFKTPPSLKTPFFDPTSKKIVINDNIYFFLWDIPTAKQIYSFPLRNNTHATFHANGKEFIAISTSLKGIYVWSLTTGIFLRKDYPTQEFVAGSFISNDEKTAVVENPNQRPFHSIIDLPSGKIIWTENWLGVIEIHLSGLFPDGNHFAANSIEYDGYFSLFIHNSRVYSKNMVKISDLGGHSLVVNHNTYYFRNNRIFSTTSGNKGLKIIPTSHGPAKSIDQSGTRVSSQFQNRYITLWDCQ